MSAAAQPDLGVSYPHRGLDRRRPNKPTAAGTDPSCRPSSLTPLTSIRRKGGGIRRGGRGKASSSESTIDSRPWETATFCRDWRRSGFQRRSTARARPLPNRSIKVQDERSSKATRVFSPTESCAFVAFPAPLRRSARGGRHHWIAIARPPSSPPNSRAAASHSPRPIPAQVASPANVRQLFVPVPSYHPCPRKSENIIAAPTPRTPSAPSTPSTAHPPDQIAQSSSHAPRTPVQCRPNVSTTCPCE